MVWIGADRPELESFVQHDFHDPAGIHLEDRIDFVGPFQVPLGDTVQGRGEAVGDPVLGDVAGIDALHVA